MEILDADNDHSQSKHQLLQLATKFCDRDQPDNAKAVILDVLKIDKHSSEAQDALKKLGGASTFISDCIWTYLKPPDTLLR